jgi:hypothetical protein
MFITDLIFGIHSQILSVYVSLGLTLCLNLFGINRLISLPLSALIFFFTVNFGVWLIDGLYPPTVFGLGLCYVAALPFLMNQMISTCLYGFVLFKGFALLERHFPTLQESY